MSNEPTEYGCAHLWPSGRWCTRFPGHAGDHNAQGSAEHPPYRTGGRS